VNANVCPGTILINSGRSASHATPLVTVWLLRFALAIGGLVCIAHLVVCLLSACAPLIAPLAAWPLLHIESSIAVAQACALELTEMLLI
jgi:hypothetical protein